MGYDGQDRECQTPDLSRQRVDGSLRFPRRFVPLLVLIRRPEEGAG